MLSDSIEDTVSLRPDVDLVFAGRKINVVMADDLVGDLSLPEELVPALRALLALPARSAAIENLSRLATSGQPGSNAGEILVETLVNAGLATRYNCPLPAELALRISRWTSGVDRVAKLLRDAIVHLIGEISFDRELMSQLQAWGIQTERIPPRGWKPDASQKASLVIAQDLERSCLRDVCGFCQRRAIPLLPIESNDDHWLVGPVFVVDVSACPFCNSVDTIPCALTPETAAEHGHKGGYSNAWAFVAECVVETLACRPGGEWPFQQYLVNCKGDLVGSRLLNRAPRCRVCSRLNHHPENAVIYGWTTGVQLT